MRLDLRDELTPDIYVARILFAVNEQERDAKEQGQKKKESCRVCDKKLVKIFFLFYSFHVTRLLFCMKFIVASGILKIKSGVVFAGYICAILYLSEADDERNEGMYL